MGDTTNNINNKFSAIDPNVDPELVEDIYWGQYKITEVSLIILN